MIVVTHKVGLARGVADSIVFMDGGVVVESGPPRELLGNPGKNGPRRSCQGALRDWLRCTRGSRECR
ncbi:ABC-type polar amino acid transport system ATPase subunit [Arthrobacter pascens]|nr:ABC-type polar amino acid transport system ATPase subunit [Arthrobacter pascens]